MQTDVFVHGATPAGIFAAIVCARAGLTVVIQAPENGIGGMLTGGLGIGDPPLDFKNWRGVVDEFTSAIVAQTGFNAHSRLAWNFEPHQALGVLTDMIAAEPNITLRLRETIVEVKRNEVRQVNGQVASSTDERATRITVVRTEPCTWLSGAPAEGDSYEATAFLDASYNSGLVMKARVPHRLGRESADEYHEWPYAGVLYPYHSNFTSVVPAVDADGDLLKYAGWTPLEHFGQADRRLMATGYRNCITNEAGPNNIGFPQPPGYVASDFDDEVIIGNAPQNAQGHGMSILTRSYAFSPLRRCGFYDEAKAQVALADTWDQLTTLQRQIGWANYADSYQQLEQFPGKFLTNGSDIRGSMSWEFTLTDSDRRRHEIREQLAYREAGRLYTFQNDPRVSEAVRGRFAQFGLCADEWQSDYILMPSWPSELYEREGRRLIGQATVTYRNVAYRTNWPDQIACGAYFMDSKAKSIWALPYGGNEIEGSPEVQPFIDADGDEVRADNYSTFGIPMRAVVAPVGTCDNLAVCWGISASELAFQAIRLEPFLCAVAEAVGHMAVESVVSGVPLAKLKYEPVRARLQAAGLLIQRYQTVTP
ncbi:FAD-dependent oxidoreductase [Paracoccus sp. PS-1]|uniref:FAD-dependent oxidoreductase n=1 Tax=Paracoccus sp. PS1 TaxID=2963938 RepID=UPI0027E3FD84|nr:FAD-dependent oxidoreductase [Paracoccus sp. PS1]MDQ7262271.1 FAD-dependent oxidoreductase [Paracoccus sp. PS1]